MKIQRQRDAYAYRLASNKYDPAVYKLTDRLQGEFEDWWAGAMKQRGFKHDCREPFDQWGEIELFLKDKYPAAYRGLNMGMEKAQPLIDQQKGHFGDPVPHSHDPYPTGPDAIAQHGYDPKEIAAGMLLLHNEAHGYRTDLTQIDHDRLFDIAQKRSKMQRDYESRQKTAMPVPRTVPKNHENWEKQRGKLNEKAQKAGVPVELVPNFSMDASDFANQAFQHQETGRPGGWYNDPVEYEGKGVPGGISHRYLEVGNAKIPVNYLLHHGDDGQINGILSHFPEGTPFEKPGSITVTVHPRHRDKGIGGKLVQEAEKRFGLKLDEQEFTPLGYEMYRRLKHERGEDVPNIFNEKTAALDTDLLDKLTGEFHDWYDKEGQEALHGNDPNMDFAADKPGLTPFVEEGRQQEMDRRGPIGYWPNIENFLKKHYPAAHKNYAAGLEQAGPNLDKPRATNPYETGPDAHTQYGYDPAEIAAAMVLLHNNSHPLRGWSGDADKDRLTKIYKTRERMQRVYEERQRKEQLQKAAYSDHTNFQTDFADDLKTGEPLDEQQLRFIDYMSRFDDMKANDRGEYTPRGGWPKAASIFPSPPRRTILAEEMAPIAEADRKDLTLDKMRDTFNDFIIKRQPVNPATGQPHTPETAIRDWQTGVIPFIQAVLPGIPFERYRYNPHTRGLNDFNDVDELTEKLIALHSQARGWGALYRTVSEREKLKQKEMARTWSRDLQNQFAKGYGINDQGKLVQMPPIGPQQQPLNAPDPTPVGQTTPDLGLHPAETTPKPMGMGGRAAAITEYDKLAAMIDWPDIFDV